MKKKYTLYLCRAINIYRNTFLEKFLFRIKQSLKTMIYFEFVLKHQKKGITFQTVSKSKSTGKMISLLDFLRKMNN